MKKTPIAARRRSQPAPVPATARAPTYDDLLAIARLIESGSRFSEFRLRSGDIEVEVKRAPPGDSTPRSGAADESGESGVVRPRAQTSGNQTAANAASAAHGTATSTQSTSNASPAADQLQQLPAGTEVIRSPMVGTFYRAPGPTEKPFVEVGSAVKPDTIVCIIEVMKLLSSVTAGMKGTVTHVFVENAQMVEFGQPLIGIRRR